jgi:hypothetical protein
MDCRVWIALRTGYRWPEDLPCELYIALKESSRHNFSFPVSENNRALPLGILIIAAVLTLGLVAYEYGELKELRTELDTKTVAFGQSQEKLRAMVRELQSGAKQLAARRSAASRDDNAKAPPAPSGRKQLDLEKAKADGQRFLAANPQVREMLQRVGQAQYAQLYGPYFRQAGLTSQQIDQMINAAMESWTQSLAVTPQGGIFPTQPQPPAEVLQSILGADAYQQLQTYQRTMPAENFVGQVATEAGYSSSPLSPTQQDQVAQIVTNASDTFVNGKTVALQSVNWDAVLEHAASLDLSPAQIDALQHMVANQKYQTALQQTLALAPPK